MSGDAAILTLADQRSYAVAAFLSGSPQEDTAGDRIIAKVAAATVRAIG